MSKSSYRYYHGQEFQAYNFGPSHAFNPIRQELTLDLVVKAGLLQAAHIRAPRAARLDELMLFHERGYIEAVQKAGGSSPVADPGRGIGSPDNPAFSGMHEAAAFRVGATLDAVQDVITGDAEHCANFAGGLHHALPGKASGFCIYNDIGVAIAWLRRTLGCKVAYVDLDAHHGDGVQWGFYDDPDVLTVSIHESGRYLFPGTGDVDETGAGDAAGTSVNIPLLPGTDGESWLECVNTVVPDVIDAFRPDILITQHGCDAHRLDPLTHLSVSVEAMERAAALLHRLAHEYCNGRWVALGGGGYAVWQVVPRAWGLIWANLCDQKPEGRLPEDWLQTWRERSPVPLPGNWRDVIDQAPITDAADFERAWRSEQNLRTAHEALKNCLPHLRNRRR